MNSMAWSKPILRRPGGSERGAALVVALALLFALTGLTALVVPLVSLETQIVANHVRAARMQYAAEAALERAIQDLGAIPDWDLVLSGARVSPMRGVGTVVALADGSRLDLQLLTNTPSIVGPGTPADPRDRRWRLFLRAPFAELAGSPRGDMRVVVVWVADDAGDGDENIVADANEMLLLHAACLGPHLAQRAVRALVRRREGGWVEAVSWEILR